MTTMLLVGHVVHRAGADALIAGQAGAVQQFEGWPLAASCVGVDEAQVLTTPPHCKA